MEISDIKNVLQHNYIKNVYKACMFIALLDLHCRDCMYYDKEKKSKLCLYRVFNKELK